MARGVEQRRRPASPRVAAAALALALASAGIAVVAAPALANFRPCGRMSAPSSSPSVSTRGVDVASIDAVPAEPSAGSGWPRFHYDAISSGLNPNEKTLGYTNVPKLRVKWRATSNGPIESSPAVSGGVVYVGSDDHRLYAFQESSGKALWRYFTGGGVRSSPAISGGVVFVGSDDGYLYAFDAASGSLVWKRSLGGAIRSSPNVVGGVVYVGSSDGSLYALHTSDGTNVWSFRTGGPIVSSPASFTQKGGTRAIYIGSDDGNVYGVRASDGTKLWAFKTGGAVQSSPAVAFWNGGDILVVGSNDQNYYGLDADSGAKKWVCATNGLAMSSPAINVALGRAYWGTNGWDIQGHNLIDGLTQWSYTCGASVRVSQAVANGMVYGGCGKDRTVYALRETLKNSPGAPRGPGAPGQRVHRMIWSFDTGGAVLSSPAVSDAMLFIGSDTGQLLAFGLP